MKKADESGTSNGRLAIESHYGGGNRLHLTNVGAVHPCSSRKGTLPALALLLNIFQAAKGGANYENQVAESNRPFECAITGGSSASIISLKGTEGSEFESRPRLMQGACSSRPGLTIRSLGRAVGKRGRFVGSVTVGRDRHFFERVAELANALLSTYGILQCRGNVVPRESANSLGLSGSTPGSLAILLLTLVLTSCSPIPAVNLHQPVAEIPAEYRK